MVMMQEAIDWAISKAEQLAASEYAVTLYSTKSNQCRFSNNSLAIVNTLQTDELAIYMVKGKRRAVGSLSSLKKESVQKFVESLFVSMNSSADAEFASLPSGSFNYSHNGDIEKNIEDFDYVEYSSRAIDAAIKSGASRVAGSLLVENFSITQKTSSGLNGHDERTAFLLNVRAFTDRDASGHGLAVSTKYSEFDVESAGREAGELSKKSRNPKQIEEGAYTILFGKSLAANIIQHVGSAASYFAVETGLSFLPDKIGEKMAVEEFSLTDHGQIRGGIHSRSFDDEGLPTQTTELVKKGSLSSFLHNSTTASKVGAKSTANAGLIEPHPWNLEVGAGSSTVEEMIKETKKGIFVTNNWYTRFQSYKTGEYSTLPRDAAFLIENGEIKHPVAGFRISDSIPRELNSIRLIGKERRWIRWWEVSIPILQPDLLIDGVRITRAVT